MFTLITVFFSLFFIALTGWTITTYVTKDDSQKLIQEELSNMLEISKMFFISIKSLIQVLTKSSFPSNVDDSTSTDSTEIDDQLLKFVPPMKEEDKAA